MGTAKLTAIGLAQFVGAGAAVGIVAAGVAKAVPGDDHSFVTKAAGGLTIASAALAASGLVALGLSPRYHVGGGMTLLVGALAAIPLASATAGAALVDSASKRL